MTLETEPVPKWLSDRADAEAMNDSGQDRTHCSLGSEMGQHLFFSPVLHFCSAKDEVEDQTRYVNSSGKEEDVSPAKLWILGQETAS